MFSTRLINPYHLTFPFLFCGILLVLLRSSRWFHKERHNAVKRNKNYSYKKLELGLSERLNIEIWTNQNLPVWISFTSCSTGDCCSIFWALFLTRPQVSRKNNKSNASTLCQKLAFPGTPIWFYVNPENKYLSKVRNKIVWLMLYQMFLKIKIKTPGRRHQLKV